MDRTLIVTGNPHISTSENTQRIMLDVCIALVPALIWAVFSFGARALILTLVCVAACVLFEYLFEKLTKKPVTVYDLSAVVTGIILAFNLPPTLPYWMAIIGCFVAIVVVKQLFGGLGQNFVNPAITARVMLLISFASPMTNWALPAQAGGSRFTSAADAIAGATPLTLQKAGEELPSDAAMFMGNIGGSMGEISAFCLILGGIYLWYKKIIPLSIPAAYIATVFIFTAALGYDPLFNILGGGVMLGAIFMATDMTTSPTNTKGRIIFGIGCGVLTVIIRMYSTYPEGVSFSILLMNVLVPHIDRLTIPTAAKAAKKAAQAAAKGGAN